MTAILNRLIDCLRHELQQYGEMLALLEQQQGLVHRRGGGEVMSTVVGINQQTAAIQAAREQRQQVRQQLAHRMGRDVEAPLKELLPMMPPHYRPLVHALISENNELIERIKLRAQQNHLLMSRSLELMQRFISSMGEGRPGMAGGENGVGGDEYRRPAGLFDPLE